MPTSVKLILHRSAIRSRKAGDFPNTERSQAPSGAFDWKAAVLVKREPLSGRHRPISIPQLRYPLKAMAMQQCSAGANYGRGNRREIARGADIAAAPPLGPGLADCRSAVAPCGGY
jgi:hypothetical protein